MEKWEHISNIVIEVISESVRKRHVSWISYRLDPETRLNQLNLDPASRLFIATELRQHFEIEMADTLPFETTQDIIDYILHKTNTSDQKTLLTTFFRDVWSSDATLNTASANALVEEVNRQNPRNVLDIGCGDNYFKNRIQNLIGIDVVNPRADIICDFMDFDTASVKFDIILALGSINFGGRKSIISMLRRIKMILAGNGRVYMRVNPGISWPEQTELIIYPWSENKIHAHGYEVGLKVAGGLQYEYGKFGPRISFTYVHSHNSYPLLLT